MHPMVAKALPVAGKWALKGAKYALAGLATAASQRYSHKLLAKLEKQAAEIKAKAEAAKRKAQEDG